MDGVDEYAEMFGIDVRRNSVTEIEDVPGTFTVARQGICNALSDDLGALS